MPTIVLDRRHLTIHLTPRAEAALAALEAPLVAEMELFFSCLIRKAVRFRPWAQDQDAVAAGDRLYVRFRPVASRACGMKLSEGPPPLMDVAIAKPGAYVPDWLRIDYRQGAWQGVFGYGTV